MQRIFSGILRRVKRLFGITNPPITDWVGYEALIDYIQAQELLSVPGDMVEIGTFLGGGAKKLAQFLAENKSNKTLHVIDVFDPTFDWSTNTAGTPMSHLYGSALEGFKGKTQLQVFQEVTKNCKNINVLKGDSKYQTIPAQSLCFAFIDGNHTPEYVENDFYLVWNKLSPKGAVSFHDYGGDVPQVTAKIDELLAKHSTEIQTTARMPEKSIIFVLRK